MKQDEYLLLDSEIRDWVVIPIILMLVLVGIGRHYVQQLIKSDPVVKKSDLAEIRYKQNVMHAARLRTNGNFINEQAFNMRKSHMIRKKTGVLAAKVPGASNPMQNPMAMVDMMKGNVTYMLPNIAMMTFVGYFFSGFLCLKVPFPMPSEHFKEMLQRGVDLKTLNISYVSSLSWYFIVTFGLNGIYMLLLGSDAQFDENQMMQMQMGMGMMGAPGQMGFDASAAYKFERENLSIAKHEWVAEKAEKTLLGDRYPDPTATQVDLSRFKIKK